MKSSRSYSTQLFLTLLFLLIDVFRRFDRSVFYLSVLRFYFTNKKNIVHKIYTREKVKPKLEKVNKRRDMQIFFFSLSFVFLFYTFSFFYFLSLSVSICFEIYLQIDILDLNKLIEFHGFSFSSNPRLSAYSRIFCCSFSIDCLS